MRILCQKLDHNNHYMIQGWKRVCEHAGFNFVVWDEKDKPAFDIFDEFSPQIFIQTSEAISRPLAKCLDRDRRIIVMRDDIIGPAFDSISLGMGEPRKELACDFLCVGNYHKKNQNWIDRFILPLAEFGKLKVFGHQPWPITQYLGSIDESNVPDAIASAALCVDVGLTPFMTERYYRYVGCGGLYLSNGRLHLGGELTYPDTISPDTYLEAARALIRKKNTLKSRVKNRKSILKEHTYFHRIAYLFRMHGLEREAAMVEEANK